MAASKSSGKRSVKGVIRELRLSNGREISYELVHGGVKNINLRISSDGRVRVSAPRPVTVQRIEEFILSKESFLLRALERGLRASGPEGPGKGGPVMTALSEEEKAEFRQEVEALVDRLLPYFAPYGVARPDLGFRTMKSRWGSCCKAKGWIHINYMLKFYPKECIKYVVVHEMAHLVEPNHSSRFYAVVGAVMPDWKVWRERLKQGRLG